MTKDKLLQNVLTSVIAMTFTVLVGHYLLDHRIVFPMSETTIHYLLGAVSGAILLPPILSLYQNKRGG